MKVKYHKINNKKNTLSDLFSQMTGDKDADPAIIKDKYEGLRTHIDKFVRAWEIFLKSPLAIVLRTDAPAAIQGIEIFVNNGRTLLLQKPRVINEKIKTEFSESIIDDLRDMGNNYDSKEINEIYRAYKISKTTDHILSTLANIKALLSEDQQRTKCPLSCLDLTTSLSNSFITSAKTSTTLLEFSTLDFKFIYNFYKDDIKKYNDVILFTLHISYISALEIYKIYMRPDIDIDKFVKAFKEKLGDIKKVISDCNGAFNCINDSLGMLERKFTDYYKEFMRTGNPNMIFELFLADIQEKNKDNKILLMQFKKLIAHIKQLVPEKLRDNEMVKNLYAMSDKIFDKTTVEDKSN